MEVKIARLGKPHGVRGEVTAQLFTDIPEERFAPGSVIDTDKDTQLTVKGYRWNKDRILLRFEEIPDRNVAEEMRDTILFADTSEEEPEEDAWYPHEIEGLKVKQDDQEIGHVLKMDVRGSQDLLTIELEDGREVFIPFVEEIVPVVNVAEGYIDITPPKGLLDED